LFLYFDSRMRLLWKDIGGDRSDRIDLSRLRGKLAFPIHSHDFPEIFWILDGRGTHRLNGAGEPLARGTVVVLRPADAHGFGAGPEGLALANAAFSPVWWRGFRRRFPGEAAALWPRGGPLRMSVSPAVLRRLQQEQEELVRSPGEALDCDRFWLNLRHALLPRRGVAGPRVERPLWMERAFEQAESRAAEGLGAADFSRLAGRSPEHVSREVRRTTGRTLTDHLQEIRVRRATDLLRTTDRTVLDIALECGFDSLGHFYAVFRKFKGQTPGGFRKELPSRIV
jgi:AraC family cel operon transcriptional repressor